MKIAVIADASKFEDFIDFLVSLEAEVLLFSENNISNKNIKHIPHKILWVQKKSYALSEGSYRERMRDEFRIVYEYVPQVTQDAEMSSALYDSLTMPLDYYVDVDGIVLLSKDSLYPRWSHPSGAPALGELKLFHKGQVHYEPSLDNVHLPDVGDVAIVGHSHHGQPSIKKILTWLIQDEQNTRRVFWVTHKENPWLDVSEKDLIDIKDIIDHSLEQKVQYFLEAHKSWQELDDYIKVKYPKPLEPIPSLVILAAHHVTSLDKHLNSSKLYITCERNYFISPSVQKENSYKDLKTLGVDQLYVFNGYKSAKSLDFDIYLREEEAGFLHYSSEQLSLETIKNDFEKKFLSFFKRES